MRITGRGLAEPAIFGVDRDACRPPNDDVANLVAGLAHCAVNRHSVTVTELRL
jgi:hypothetical protein